MAATTSKGSSSGPGLSRPLVIALIALALSIALYNLQGIPPRSLYGTGHIVAAASRADGGSLLVAIAAFGSLCHRLMTRRRTVRSLLQMARTGFALGGLGLILTVWIFFYAFPEPSQPHVTAVSTGLAGAALLFAGVSFLALGAAALIFLLTAVVRSANLAVGSRMRSKDNQRNGEKTTSLIEPVVTVGATLRIIARLMPAAAGRRWLAEANGVLFDVPAAQRPQFTRNYLTSAPAVIATAWSEDLSRRVRIAANAGRER